MTRAERVLEARRMMKEGEFNRAVVSSEAEDLSYDRLHLECGHGAVWATAWDIPANVICHRCAEAWIEAGDGQSN